MRRTGGWIGLAVAMTGLAIATPALAHTGVGIGGGLGAGFFHPFLGFDHLLAMLSVGALGAMAGGAALWALPATFMAIMAMGGAFALIGIGIPGVEQGIAASLVVFGALLATRAGLPTAAAMAVVAVFALFHGHAHGAELPDLAAPLPYVLGFVAATGILHLLGIAIAQGMKRMPIWSDLSVRAAGGAVAAAGLILLIG
jgi:urease accessory protein